MSIISPLPAQPRSRNAVVARPQVSLGRLFASAVVILIGVAVGWFIGVFVGLVTGWIQIPFC